MRALGGAEGGAEPARVGVRLVRLVAQRRQLRLQPQTAGGAFLYIEIHLFLYIEVHLFLYIEVHLRIDSSRCVRSASPQVNASAR